MTPWVTAIGAELSRLERGLQFGHGGDAVCDLTVTAVLPSLL